MTTALFTHAACLGHVTPPGHPERVARLEAISRTLAAPAFSALDRREAPLADENSITLAHPPSFVEHIMDAIPARGFATLDADTSASPGSGNASLRAAGALIAAVDATMTGEVRNAFCAVRPPGHHAERETAMGFCIFNSVAVGAHHARQTHGAARVAVIDWDVHHGNGTQDIFRNDRNLFYASTHQSPLYPGTGQAGDTGIENNIMNAPLPPGAGGEIFRPALDAILDVVEKFLPDLIIISAGFDAHAADPLAQLQLNEDDYAWATRRIMDVADKICGGRIVSALEGGYDLDALAASTAVHVSELMSA